MSISPLAPKDFPDMPNVPGISIATAHSGMRYENRDDLCLITMEDETRVAGFSQNHFVHQRPSTGAKKISNTASEGHYFATPVMQSAFTGAKGEQIVEESATVLSETLSISKDHIYLASTGVIGKLLNLLNLRVILIKWQIVSKRPEQHRGRKLPKQ